MAFLAAFSSAASAAVNLDFEKSTYSTLTSETVTLTGHSELHVTGSGDPIPGCTIHLNSEDSWVFFHNVTPSAVISSLLSRIRVNGAVAVADSNVRVVQHVAGAVVIPYTAAYQPLRVFTGAHLTGSSRGLGPYTAYGDGSLGVFSNNVRSFVLKRGYTATFAQNENGTGISRNFVAQDSDLEVSLMPSGLDGDVSFIRIFPWRWVSKKGSCDVDPGALNAKWHYNWNISANSTADREYAAIRQQPYWPGLDQDWKARGINHLLGFNEPNNPVEDAYKNLTPQGSVSDAVARWPDLLATGLRVGAPAVTDGGYGWIADFINQANAAGVRVDYVPVHYYRSYANKNDPAGAAAQMYNFLKSIYDVAQRPIWVTEFNNGANWTDNAHDPDVTQNRNAIEAMVQMMDNTPWIERYAVYSNVEWFRKTHYDDGSLTPMGTMYRDRVAPMAYQQVVPNFGNSGNAGYLFEGSTRDTISGNNPLIYGTPKIVPGKHGSALSLDGTDDYLALPGRLGDSNDFSFAAWIKWDGGANWQRIFDLGNGTANYLFLSPKSGGGTLRFAMKLNNGTEQQLNAPALTPNVWTHVAVTIAGDTGKLFVNGSLVNTNASMTINPSQIGTEGNYLGRSQFADPLFDGQLDDVRFFNSGLTDAQVAALANSTPPQFVASPSVGSAALDLPFTGDLAPLIASGNGSLTFSKISGPAWLSVAADGSLFGVPRLGDVGQSEMLVSAASSGGAITTAVIPLNVVGAELVARYAFNNSALATAGGVNAVLAGGSTYVAGQSGQAINLDGIDDHAVLPAGIASSDEITIASWVNWDGGGNWQRIFDFGNGTGSYMFLTPKSGSNTLRFVIKNGGAEQTVETTALATGTWVHLAVTLSPSGGRLYVNGSLAASNAAMTIKPADFRPATNFLGRSQFTADPYFDGRLDEFHVFRRALSAAEISSLRIAPKPVLASNPLVLAQAVPGSSYEGTISGAATVSSGTVSYSKVEGPAWLTIEPDGRVSGVPAVSESGTPAFRVRATSSISPVIATDLDLVVPVQAPADLKVHYEMDGNPADTTGIYPATASGSPGYAGGLFDQAIDLDGTDDYLQAPSGFISNLTDATFVTRFRWDGGAAWQRLFDFGNNTTQYLFLTPNSASGTMRFGITLGGNATQEYLDAPMAPAGEWTHVAVVLSGSTGTIYVNGAAVSTGTITLDPSNVAPTLNYIGKSQWPDPYFNGAIDELRIFNRALNAAEVKALAVPPAAVIVPRPGYAAWASGITFPSGKNGPEDDADGDRLSNLVEWLFGSDPLDAGSAPLPAAVRYQAAALGLADGKTYLGFSSRVRRDRPGTTLIPEAAATLDDLGSTTAAANVSQAGPPVDDGAFEIFTWYYKVPIEDVNAGFIRLRVTNQ
ncbi:LamG-like jellyroll fold domain-containing protein [Luteolibacter luteus]|uniref:LamG-like jellyroll fold domain-containing protein n=1 Tax=Luteolibacter luteus TaxID=2728835 RepID=A0A858RMI8_9BACT|nr:LamG-like jellyroll fold domain-containing protein [Luteolibacter luteus]QJE97925.1 hypothetical protein HHL09_19755 [Luteolibacter luteus]